MTKILVEVDESDYGAVCDRCGETFGQHTIWDCPDGKGRFSKFKEREVMTYNKETVIGVFKQCQDMLPESSVYRRDFEDLIELAKEGKFTIPTLEEVWKRKRKEAGKKGLEAFSFDFDGEHYISKRVFEGYNWSMPLKAEKL
jgi:hypothetical protein